MKLKERAVYTAFATGWSAIRFLPEKTAYRTFDRIAHRLWKKRGPGVRQLERNLSRVQPDASYEELRELSLQGMRSYFRYWCDAFRMPDWSEERIKDTFEIYGVEHLEDALASGRGAIVAACHMGNWDHTGAWGALSVGPVTAVAEKLEPERLFERFVKFRTTLGMRIYPLGQPHVADTLAHELRTENRIVGLISDRDLTARGIEVNLFGKPTRMPAGPANLALRTGAALLPATLWYNGPNACTRIHPPVPIPPGAPTGDDARNQPGYNEAVQLMTQQVANAFEEGIAAHPTDWHMMQKVWLEDLNQDRLAASDAAGGRKPDAGH